VAIRVCLHNGKSIAIPYATCAEMNYETEMQVFCDKDGKLLQAIKNDDCLSWQPCEEQEALAHAEQEQGTSEATL